jgi:L-serine dehydratase
MAAANALSCANMALSDYEHLVPLDEVIDTMKVVGDQIHHTLRCTNLGGLSVTRAAKKIEAMLEAQPQHGFKSC